MVYTFKGIFDYDKRTIEDWNSIAMGVYYCGSKTVTGKLTPLYIGLGTSDGGMRMRLLDHLRENNWPFVTHFGYRICDTAREAEQLEANEIDNYKPKYNIQGK